MSLVFFTSFLLGALVAPSFSQQQLANYPSIESSITPQACEIPVHALYSTISTKDASPVLLSAVSNTLPPLPGTVAVPRQTGLKSHSESQRNPSLRRKKSRRLKRRGTLSRGSNAIKAKRTKSSHRTKRSSNGKPTKVKPSQDAPVHGKAGSKQTDSGSRTPLIIRAKVGISRSDQTKAQSRLQAIAGKGNKVRTTPSKTGIRYWQVKLTSSELSMLRKDPVSKSIKSIEPDALLPESEVFGEIMHGSSSPRKPGNTKGPKAHSDRQKANSHVKASRRRRSATDGNLTKRGRESVQDPAPWELAMLSTNHIVDSQVYTYDQSAGQGVRIYGIDTGLDAKHEQVKEYERGETGKLGWLYASERGWSETDSKDGHGSCVWAKAVGPKDGVAKKASYTVVKLKSQVVDESTYNPAVSGKTSGFLAGDLVNSFSVSAYWIRKKKEKAVVTVSLGLAPLSRIKSLYKDFKDTMTDLQELGVPVFYAADNESGKPIDLKADPVHELNAEFANFFVVGGVKDIGTKSTHTGIDPPGKSIINFWAPGEEISCIGPLDGEGGNSFATPMVAGLAAYAMGLPNGPKSVADLVTWLKERQEPWIRGGPDVVGNDFRPARNK